jgi:hypothetical protein
MSEAIGEYVKGDWSQLPGTEVTRRELGFAARHALMNVIEHVLASSDRTVTFVGEDPNADDKWARAEIEAEPPFETVDEAVEAGIMVSLLWQDVSRRLFAPDKLDHLDAFIKRGSTENEGVDDDALIKFGHTVLDGSPLIDGNWSLPGEEQMTVEDRQRIAGELEEALDQIKDHGSDT